MVLCILSLLASSVKEAQSYTSQIMMVAILPYFLLMGKSGLLGFGALVDYIAKKRSIELDLEEGIHPAAVGAG